MSAMRSPLGGFGWGVLVEVDEGAVFALCFPRSQNGAVRFYESATSPPANSLVHTHCWWGGCPQRGVRKRERTTRRSCGAPVVHESTAGPRFPRWILGRCTRCVDSYNPWVGTNHGCMPSCPQCRVGTGHGPVVSSAGAGVFCKSRPVEVCLCWSRQRAGDDVAELYTPGVSTPLLVRVVLSAMRTPV